MSTGFQCAGTLYRAFIIGVFVACVFVIGNTVVEAAPVVVVSGSVASASVSDESANVAFAHFAPFAGDVAATSITLKIDGSTIMTDTTYGQTAFNLPATPGQRLFEMEANAWKGGKTVTATIPISSAQNSTVILVGGTDLYPLEFFTVADTMAPNAGNALIRLINVGPDSRSDEPQVELCTPDGQVVQGISDIGYKQTSDYLQIPAGNYVYSVAVTGSNCGQPIVSKVTVNAKAGDVVDLFFVGRANSGPTYAENFPYGVVSVRNSAAVNDRFAYLPVVLR